MDVWTIVTKAVGTEKGKLYQRVADFYTTQPGWLACSETSLYFRNDRYDQTTISIWSISIYILQDMTSDILNSMDPGLFYIIDTQNIEKVTMIAQPEGKRSGVSSLHLDT